MVSLELRNGELFYEEKGIGERVRGLVLVAPVISGYEPSGAVAQFNEQEEALLENGNLKEATELNLQMWVDGPYRTSEAVDPMLRKRVGEMQYEAFSQPSCFRFLIKP
jgi:3-oxoadipate enol-lactonase